VKTEYEPLARDALDDTHRTLVAELLRKQGKVRGNLATKADRCQLLCISRVDDQAVAIGAIKPATSADFDADKSGLVQLRSAFEWELGYLYTEPAYARQGIASNIVRLLLRRFGGGNLMASTEMASNMARILESNGFRFVGAPWPSAIHGNFLGLFVRFVQILPDAI
jgi:GNAT superfamily N-acetyltransferase